MANPHRNRARPVGYQPDTKDLMQVENPIVREALTSVMQQVAFIFERLDQLINVPDATNQDVRQKVATRFERRGNVIKVYGVIQHFQQQKLVDVSSESVIAEIPMGLFSTQGGGGGGATTITTSTVSLPRHGHQGPNDGGYADALAGTL